MAAIADARPDWQLILVGPVVKIAPEDLPRRPNIHYLGRKSYAELPAYLAGWDAAFMPFAINELTRFISPTKTPEYLAAGRPVVSTPVADVVRDYGSRGLVRIASTPAGFVSALEACLADQGQRSGWLEAVDRQLETMSWDRTWSAMKELMARSPKLRQSDSVAVAPPRTGSLGIRNARSGFDYLIVGAGFAGSVLAERLAAGLGQACAPDRPAAAHRRERLRPLR